MPCCILHRTSAMVLPEEGGEGAVKKSRQQLRVFTNRGEGSEWKRVPALGRCVTVMLALQHAAASGLHCSVCWFCSLFSWWKEASPSSILFCCLWAILAFRLGLWWLSAIPVLQCWKLMCKQKKKRKGKGNLQQDKREKQSAKPHTDYL